MTLPAEPLLHQVQAATRRARKAGALQPIQTKETLVADGGITFVIRMISSLARKHLARRRQAASPGNRKRANPFLPYDPALFVADLSPTHVVLLNKFPVMEDHLLIVTRAFEDQERLLTQADFEATWISLAEMDGLAFYNGGVVAGASQPHKHLQLVPLPLSSRGPALPVAPLLKNLPAKPTRCPLPSLPFRHAAMQLPPRADAATAHACFLSLLHQCGLEPAPDGCQPMPYNLLLRRDWLLLVPRSKEHALEVSINALGFAGSLFVKNHEELDRLQAHGPMKALTEVSLPR